MLAVDAVADILVVAAFSEVGTPVFGGVYVPKGAIGAYIGLFVDVPKTVVAYIGV